MFPYLQVPMIAIAHSNGQFPPRQIRRRGVSGLAGRLTATLEILSFVRDE
jgi:hypothetical protein